jgi:hypothetical protein
MAIKKSSNGKLNVGSSHNECAGVISQPTVHENPGEKTMPEAAWKSPEQLAAEQKLSKWFGRKGY